MDRYQLRSRFESATGSVWSLNIGQVYTTLARLERDAMVQGAGAGDDGRVIYRLTDAGRAELSACRDSPVAHQDRPRDELAIKIALAVTTPDVDAGAILQTQRRETIRHLQDLTRIKRHADADDLSWRLVIESMIFAAEADQGVGRHRPAGRTGQVLGLRNVTRVHGSGDAMPPKQRSTGRRQPAV